MTLTRRSTLSLAGGAAAMGLLGWRRFMPVVGEASAAQPAPAAPAGDQRKTERSLGDPAAKVTVQEFFSLTCTHCAAFAQETMPEIEKTLIAPGKLRFVYHDFPLDQVALTAAMVARYLPPAQVLSVRSGSVCQPGPLGLRARCQHNRRALEAGGTCRHEPRHLRPGDRRQRPAELDPPAAAGRSGSLEDRLRLRAS